MKTLLFCFGIIFSTGVSAQSKVPSIKASILPQAKITQVSCTTPSPKDHDWSLAGKVQVLSKEGQVVMMNMAVSRFEDEQVEAKKLCKSLKTIQSSSKSIDLIFTEETDFNEREEIRLDIKGGVSLSGLDPFYNG
jgi:hypothetical protein